MSGPSKSDQTPIAKPDSKAINRTPLEFRTDTPRGRTATHIGFPAKYARAYRSGWGATIGRSVLIEGKGNDGTNAENRIRVDAQEARTCTRRTAHRPNKVEVSVAGSLDSKLAKLPTLTGIQRPEVGIRVASQVSGMLRSPKLEDADRSLFVAIGAVAELSPRNGMEGMLAAQMVATHEAAMGFIELATREGLTCQERDANAARATRFMRLQLEQIEAMQKLKGQAGQQRVTVEHVHVHKGGQAIVGAVSSGVPGVGGGTGTR